jgi:hypothetical protein
VPKTAKRPTFSWGNVSIEQQRAVVEMFGDDGHSILNADVLRTDSDVPDYVIDAFTTVEKSDGSLKGSIFTDAGVVAELRGIYCLTVIRSLAAHYGVVSHKFGRGSEARELTAGILEHLGKEAGE